MTHRFFILLPIFLLLNAITAHGQIKRFWEKQLSKQELLSDLDVAYNKICSRHVNPFWKIDSLSYSKEYNRIRSAVKNSEVSNFTLEDLMICVQELLSYTGDVHANLYQIRGESNCNLYPLHFKKFNTTDGYEYRVIKTDSIHHILLGAKILSIENVQISAVEEKLKKVFPKNFPESEYFLTRLALRNANLLHGLGIASTVQNTQMTFELSSGEKQTMEIASLSQSEIKKTTFLNYDAILAKKPLSAQHPELYFWFQYLPDSKALYLRNTAVANNSNETTIAFSKRMFAFIDSVKAKKLIIDLRDNSGGNGFLSFPFIASMQKSTLNKDGKIFCLSNGLTFSAAIIFQQNLDGKLPVITIGEAPADAPNFCSDFFTDTLPNSKLPIAISKFEIMNSFEYDNRKNYHPEIPCKDFTWEEYNKGKDRMIETALNYQGMNMPLNKKTIINVVGKYGYNIVKTAAIIEKNGNAYLIIPGEIETPLYKSQSADTLLTTIKDLKIYFTQKDLKLVLRGNNVKILERISAHQSTPFETISDATYAQTLAFYTMQKNQKPRNLYMAGINLGFDIYKMYLRDHNTKRTELLLRLNEDLNKDGKFLSDYTRELLKQ